VPYITNLVRFILLENNQGENFGIFVHRIDVNYIIFFECKEILWETLRFFEVDLKCIMRILSAFEKERF
jgi:hypothetical protein